VFVLERVGLPKTVLELGKAALMRELSVGLV